MMLHSYALFQKPGWHEAVQFFVSIPIQPSRNDYSSYGNSRGVNRVIKLIKSVVLIAWVEHKAV